MHIARYAIVLSVVLCAVSATSLNTRAKTTKAPTTTTKAPTTTTQAPTTPLPIGSTFSIAPRGVASSALSLYAGYSSVCHTLQAQFCNASTCAVAAPAGHTGAAHFQCMSTKSGVDNNRMCLGEMCDETWGNGNDTIPNSWSVYGPYVSYCWSATFAGTAELTTTFNLDANPVVIYNNYHRSDRLAVKDGVPPYALKVSDTTAQYFVPGARYDLLVRYHRPGNNGSSNTDERIRVRAEPEGCLIHPAVNSDATYAYVDVPIRAVFGDAPYCSLVFWTQSGSSSNFIGASDWLYRRSNEARSSFSTVCPQCAQGYAMSGSVCVCNSGPVPNPQPACLSVHCPSICGAGSAYTTYVDSFGCEACACA